MRLRTRLVLLIIAVSLVPLGILGFGAIQVSVGRLTQTVSDGQARTVDQLASEIDLWLQFEVSQVSEHVDAFTLARLNDRKLEGFQRLVFQQIVDVHIVAIVNDEGRELSPSLFLDQPGDGRLNQKEAVSVARLTAFRAALPVERMVAELEAWGANGVDPATNRPIIVGQPYTPPGRKLPVVPVVVPADPDAKLFLAVELALDRIDARFRRTAENGVNVVLLDASGQVAVQRGRPLIEPKRFRVFQPSSSCAEVQYRTQAGLEVLGACAPVEGTGWMVVVAEPMSAITQAGEEIRNRTGFISVVAAIISILIGLLFSSGIAERITRVRDAALAVAEGELGRTVALGGVSEIRELSLAFNFMSRRLSSNQDRISTQQGKIAQFNEELQRQLHAQEAELNEAHKRLLQSSRLAAVGEMGAGMAHELNNPLAGILGLVQILQMKSDEPGLTEIEKQAQRCREIVQQLLRFSRSSAAPAPLNEGDWAVVDFSKLVQEVLALVEGPFAANGIEVTSALTEGVLVRGDADLLSGAIIQLVNSIRGACVGGGAIEITGGETDGLARVDLRLSARAIDPHSDDWMASGMGFWLARQVLAQHGGGLTEPVGDFKDAATWTIRIPLN